MSCKLIIVEDERSIRESLASFEWDTIGVEVVASFDNGLSALEFLKEQEAQIALVDMRMPIMDGVTFIKCVRKEFPQISIVCLSGYSDYEYLFNLTSDLVGQLHSQYWNLKYDMCGQIISR